MMAGVSLRQALSNRNQSRGRLGVRQIADRLGLTYPVSCAQLVDVLAPIVLNFSLTAGSTSAKGEITMISSGGVHFRGSIHDGGLVSVKYSVAAVFTNAVSDPRYGMIPLLLTHQGEIAGTFGFGSRDDGWDESTINDSVFANWRTIKQAASTSTTNMFTAWDAYEAFEAAVAGFTGAFVLNL